MEFLALLVVVAAVWSAWQFFGDESVTDVGTGDAGSDGGSEEGGSEVTSESSSEASAEEPGVDKFTEALEKAGVKGWAEAGKRWHEKAKKAGEYETQLAEAQQKLKEYEEKQSSASETQTRTDSLTKQAITQGFTRSQVKDYLEDHTLEDLDARLAKDRGEASDGDGDEKTPRAVKEALARIAKLERAVSTKEQNSEMQRQLGESLGKHAADFDDEGKAMIAGFLEQAVEAARASGQKLPNVDSAVKNLAARFKSLAEKAVGKYKEQNKGKGVAGTSEQPNKDFEEQVSSEESDVQAMLKLFQK